MSRGPSRLWLGACALACAAAANSAELPRARAFSDPAQFAAPVLEAGGGGRFYTGSPAEGYGCDSCHAGAAAPDLEIQGLPSRYVPRATYELRVLWPRSLEHAAAVLEVTDERGVGAGSLTLPPPGAYLPDEQCAPQDLGLLAAQLYEADRQRTVAATPDCGATMLRVQWTAPARDVGPIWLAGSVIASNHDGDFSGDGARRFARAIPPFGAELPDVETRGGCSVSQSPQPRASMHALGLTLALGLALAAVSRPRRGQLGLYTMISHEPRLKPVPLWTLRMVVSIILVMCSACNVHESIWSEEDGVSVTLGNAVSPWSDAQVVARVEDASAEAAVSESDGPPTDDAGVSDSADLDDVDDMDDLDAGDSRADASVAPDAATPRDADHVGPACEFRVTTLSMGGKYAPKNIGAIWLERADGSWVRTLALWAGVRLRYLKAYRAANPTGNKVDAITSATLRAFGDHVVPWDLADVEGQMVPDGEYRVMVEVTDRDEPGPTLELPFTKMTPPFVSRVSDSESFQNVELRCF